MRVKKLLVVLGVAVSTAFIAQAEEEFKINGDAEAGGKTFGLYCAACHGAGGAGDGVAAAALNPKPADLTNKEYMDTLSDKHIYTVIKDGGAAVGKSPMMTAWGALLKEDQQIHDVAAFVKSLSAE